MEQCGKAVFNSSFPSVCLFFPCISWLLSEFESFRPCFWMRSNSTFSVIFVIIARSMFEMCEIPLLNVVLDAGFIHYYLYVLFLSQDTVHFSQAQHVHL